MGAVGRIGVAVAGVAVTEAALIWLGRTWGTTREERAARLPGVVPADLLMSRDHLRDIRERAEAHGAHVRSAGAGLP